MFIFLRVLHFLFNLQEKKVIKMCVAEDEGTLLLNRVH